MTNILVTNIMINDTNQQHDDQHPDDSPSADVYGRGSATSLHILNGYNGYICWHLIVRSFESCLGALVAISSARAKFCSILSSCRLGTLAAKKLTKTKCHLLMDQNNFNRFLTESQTSFQSIEKEFVTSSLLSLFSSL